MSGDDPIELAGRGPRIAAMRDEVLQAMHDVRAGCRLHYDPSADGTDDDLDIALLDGDHLYAVGLARLAAAGDLVAIAELADVISLNAQARIAGDVDLAQAAWQAVGAAIGWGPTDAIAIAKARARAGEEGAARDLRAAASGVLA